MIGIAVSSATKCNYCTYFHTEAARLFGATEEEIENAVHYAKMSTGWSTYVNGLQIDLEQFKEEVTRMFEYVHSNQPVLK